MRFVGPHIDDWTRSGSAEVDLVGGDTKPVADAVAFLGSLKWRDSGPCTRANGEVLAAQCLAVPGAGPRTDL